MSGLVTRAVQDAAGLARLAPAWWDLWRRCPTATPFQTPGWLLSWWRHFAPGPLLTSAAFRDGQLVGLFPCYGEQGRAARLLPLGIPLSDYLDVLLDRCCAEAGEALLERTLAGAWNVWSLEELAPEALGLGLRSAPGLADVVAEQHACPVLELSGPDDLAGCVPARRRRQLRRARMFAERRGAVCITRLEHDAAAFLDVLFALHAARWESRGEAGVLASGHVQSFHREALGALLAAGLARCYVLAIGGRPAAAYYGFHARDRAYAYLAGFDPAYAEESPGAIVVGHAIQEAIREGAREFHFLRGREAYKYTWGARDRWNRRRTWTRALRHE